MYFAGVISYHVPVEEKGREYADLALPELADAKERVAALRQQ
jgi:hypothetical protein